MVRITKGWVLGRRKKKKKTNEQQETSHMKRGNLEERRGYSKSFSLVRERGNKRGRRRRKEKS